MNLIRNACTFIGQGHLIIGVKKKKKCHYHQLTLTNTWCKFGEVIFNNKLNMIILPFF